MSLSRLRPLLLDNYDSYTYNLFQLLHEVTGGAPVVFTNDGISLDEVRQLIRDGSINCIVISPGPGNPECERDIGVCLELLRGLPDVPILGVCLGHQALAHSYGGRVVKAPEPVHGRLSELEHSGHPLFRGIPSGQGQGFHVVRYHSLIVEDCSMPSCLEPIAWTVGHHEKQHSVSSSTELVSELSCTVGSHEQEKGCMDEQRSVISVTNTGTGMGSSVGGRELEEGGKDVTACCSEDSAAPGTFSVHLDGDAPVGELSSREPSHHGGIRNGHFSSSVSVNMAIAHRSRPHFGVQFHPESISTRYGVAVLHNFAAMSATVLGLQVPRSVENFVGPPGHSMPPRSWPDPTQSTRKEHMSLGLSWRCLKGALHAAGGSLAIFEHLVQWQENSFWLDSSSSDRGRFSYMGARGGPLWQRITFKLPAPGSADSAAGVVRVEHGSGAVEELPGTFFDYLEATVTHHQMSISLDDAQLPFNFWGGLVGYLGFELKAECGGHNAHRSAMPDAAFLLVDRLLAVDHQTGDVFLLAMHEQQHQHGTSTQATGETAGTAETARATAGIAAEATGAAGTAGATTVTAATAGIAAGATGGSSSQHLCRGPDFSSNQVRDRQLVCTGGDGVFSDHYDNGHLVDGPANLAHLSQGPKDGDQGMDSRASPTPCVASPGPCVACVASAGSSTANGSVAVVSSNKKCSSSANGGSVSGNVHVRGHAGGSSSRTSGSGANGDVFVRSNSKKLRQQPEVGSRQQLGVRTVQAACEGRDSSAGSSMGMAQSWLDATEMKLRVLIAPCATTTITVTATNASTATAAASDDTLGAAPATSTASGATTSEAPQFPCMSNGLHSCPQSLDSRPEACTCHGSQHAHHSASFSSSDTKFGAHEHASYPAAGCSIEYSPTFECQQGGKVDTARRPESAAASTEAAATMQGEGEIEAAGRLGATKQLEAASGLEAAGSKGRRQRQQMPAMSPFRLRHERSKYIANVRAYKKALHDGESYEVCATTALIRHQLPDPAQLYRTLRTLNPAPYAAWLCFGTAGPTLCCSSPERFLRGDRGGVLEARPIKGTAPRVLHDSVADAASAAALLASMKDRAENLMIVDLLRNDLGRVCEVGSVHVPGLMEIESFATVHQMVSTVRGLRRSGVSLVECIRTAFPGGSMTGAPKVRTMEILDAQEGFARGPYSGSLGFIGFNDTFDLNIIIRTAIMFCQPDTASSTPAHAAVAVPCPANLDASPGAAAASGGEAAVADGGDAVGSGVGADGAGACAGGGEGASGADHLDSHSAYVHNTLSIGAGGAIVVQSNDEDEYEEMRLKARALLHAVGRCDGVTNQAAVDDDTPYTA